MLVVASRKREGWSSQAARADAAGSRNLAAQGLLVVATCQGKGCWESQPGRARAAGLASLKGQMLLVVASWQGQGCWLSQAGRARAAASHVGGFAPKPPADGAPTPSAVESAARCCAIAWLHHYGPRAAFASPLKRHTDHLLALEKPWLAR